MNSTHKIILICAILGAVSILIILAATVLYCRQRRRNVDQQKARAWSGDRDLERRRKAPQVIDPSTSPNGSPIAAAPEFVEGASAARVEDYPPTIPLPSGWPKIGSPTSPSARRAEKRREALGPNAARASRLMDDTPFELGDDTEEGSGEAISLSTAHAEAGSVPPSAAPSRNASRRGRARSAGARRSGAAPTNNNRPIRHSRAASMWSWSHRATPSVAETDIDGEPLPAYTFRRSGSTTRSRDSRMPRRQSRASIRAHDGDAAGAHNFPRDLAKKIALFYKKPPLDQDPPEYR